MNIDSRIFVSGHRGLVGSALIRLLESCGFTHLITATHSEIDLTDPVATKWFFSVHRPEYVFHCAARVGGIQDNINNPLDFFLANMKMEMNVLGAAAEYNVKKLIFLGSSCIYPRDCPQPIRPEYLLTGPFEQSTEAYGLAKVAGVKLCQWYRKECGCDFVSAMPCNIYGPNDNFNPVTAHVVPGLLSRLHDAKVSHEDRFFVWGDGSAKRELIYSDDVASALVCLMERGGVQNEPVNLGTGFEVCVRDIATHCAVVVDYRGQLCFDARKPSGTPQKIMDSSVLRSWGWTPKVDFHEGLVRSYNWLKSNL